MEGDFCWLPSFCCANKCRFGETTGFRVLKINRVAFGVKEIDDQG